jgi:AP-4 complex subunit epsilon-1
VTPASRVLSGAAGECKSKAEEDAIVTREVEVLKKRLADPMVDKSRMQEYLLRLVYVEMLGHSASFGYIHAVKMTHEPLVSSKKVGYLATSLFLNESHDLLILIVNTLQQDLKSDNPLVGAPRRRLRPRARPAAS